jgi:hypothetical protein
MENIVDFLSSAVVLWRFFAPTSIDDAIERKLRRREKRASVAISFIMVILGLMILSAAISDMKRGPEDVLEYAGVLSLSFFSLLVFGTLTAIKFRYSAKLDSASLYKDGICSLIGTVLAATLFINTLIVVHHENIWWIDPIAAFLAGIIAIVIGVRALFITRSVEEIPIFTWTWWRSSSEESNESQTGNVEIPPTGSESDNAIV